MSWTLREVCLLEREKTNKDITGSKNNNNNNKNRAYIKARRRGPFLVHKDGTVYLVV